MSAPNIIDFCKGDYLLGRSLSTAQEALLRAADALPFDDEHLRLYRQFTGREEPPTAPVPELVVIAGARSGKDSRIAAPIALFEALFGDHERQLAPGEKGLVPVVAQDKRAAQIAFGFIESYVTESPLLSGRVEEVLTEELILDNGIRIQCFPNTRRALRGWSIPVAVLDEVAFFRVEGAADSDVEIQASVRRGQVSFPGAKLVKISTPYMKSGILWEDFSEHYGDETDDILVWQAPTRAMNPTVSEERLERERRRDPERFAREYMAEFSDSLTGFLPFDWIRRAVVPDRGELPPREQVAYTAAVDPCGGGADSFTLSVAHADGDPEDFTVVVDLVRGWGRTGGEPPELRGVVSEIARILEKYGVDHAIGDRYAAGWVRQAFDAEGIRYVESPWTKSEAYLEALPLFSQTRLELPDHAKLTRQFQSLERRTRSGGRGRVDHPPGGHDDFANVAALAAVAVADGRWHWAEPVDVIQNPEDMGGEMFGGLTLL